VVTGTIGRPARRIDLAVRFHDCPFAIDLANTLPKVARQFLDSFELFASRLIAIKIADETNAESDVVEVIAVHVATVDLSAPSVPDFDFSIAC
jgi:hypothetical protein